MKKIFLAFVAILGLVLTGCASSIEGSPNNSEITQIIDVRTAAEYSEGHIANSINFDVEAGSFATQISTLDKSGVYLVYCRSGRRSAIAATAMAEAGFTVQDGGGLDSMLSNGWELGQ